MSWDTLIHSTDGYLVNSNSVMGDFLFMPCYLAYKGLFLFLPFVKDIKVLTPYFECF